MNEEIFSLFESLTFDDLLVEPGYSEILPSQTDVRGQLAGDIWLNIPILSAAMDTVTEGRLAIALAREGGIGIIHRNLSPEAQAREVEVVKRSESGMISDPVTLPPTASLQEAEDIMMRFHISGVPVVDPGSQKLVGILTNRDIRFTEPADYSRPLSDFMTSENLRPAQVREAVLALRRTKSMVLDLDDPNHRSVGSFFVNPVVSPAVAAQVSTLAVARGASAQTQDVSRFPGPGGQVKLSAAWLIEHAGVYPGFALGNVGVSTNHVLALVNNGGGSTAELLALAVHVRDVVREAFGVVLEPEPAFLGFSAPPLTPVRC